jgi:dTDP-4-amino-4,6-dideoxygalactose transaminase
VFDREEFGRSRDDIYNQLLAHDVHARKYFYPAINELAVYRNVYNNSNTPIAHRISLNILTLPIYEELSLEDVDMICDIILNGD